jgi:arylsulfatase A-like enzyme
MSKQFKGDVKLDVRDSTPDWGPFLEEKAPEGSPNVLIVLYDDTGLAAWSPFGGRIQMPTMQRLADDGLTYSQWHTTALCSPTRSCFLTGRNHHQNGFAQIAEGASGFPGHSGHIPMENAAVAEVLRERGWNTFWIGKNHNVPVDEWGMGASKRNWPLARGFDRFYGFIGGETNNWYPNLVEDNHYIDQPYLPEDGYHLSKDLADKAISFIRDSKQSAPEKPWFMWFCPGANHAPHHVPKEWADKYKGKFDDGYEAYRKWVLPRMIEKGILPEGTELTEINPLPREKISDIDLVRPWESLSADEKRLFSRMAEVYAGFSEYTDHQVGRIIDDLEESGQLDNTLIFYCADNGASGEGTPNGSVNEQKFFNAWPDDMAENLAMIDRLGTPDTYNHYPTGWAMGFSTPFRMFKRYTYQGGIADPLVIHWPKGIKAKGEVRNQYHHATDIVPTILECCGVEMPDFVLGYEQTPLPGVSMHYSFDQGDAPTEKKIQYYEMFGTRGLWSGGWKAATEHAPVSGVGNFAQEKWQLFHTDEDRSEAHDVADQHPEKLAELIDLWYVEAGKYNVLPLDDRTVTELVAAQPASAIPASGVYTYYPDTTEIPEFSAANTRGRSYKILAEVEIEEADAGGVIIAQGARFGGHTLFVKDQKLYYVYNFIGISPEQKLVSNGLAPGKHVLGMEFVKDKTDERGVTHGTAKLYIDDKVVDEGPLRTQPGHFALCGEGLSVGRDTADPVSSEYSSPFAFTGGRIAKVEVDVGGDAYIDVERDFAAAFARD